MTELKERIAKLKELEAKATSGEWQGDLENCLTTKEQHVYFNNACDAKLTAYLRNNALAIIEELEAENEELKQRVRGKVRSIHAAGRSSGHTRSR